LPVELAISAWPRELSRIYLWVCSILELAYWAAFWPDVLILSCCLDPSSWILLMLMLFIRELLKFRTLRVRLLLFVS